MRVPPHDLEAEVAVLGSCLLDSWAAGVAVTLLQSADFYQPANAHVFAAIDELHNQGQPTDTLSVAARLEATGLLATIGGRERLRTIEAQAPLTRSVTHYANVIAEYGRCRRIIAYSEQLADAAYTGRNDDVDIALAATDPFTLRTTAVEKSPKASELVLEERPPDWVIPHLIARLEAVLFVAEPGAGKTTLMRQIAAASASGIHPFTGEHIRPITTHTFDFQDPPGPAIRATRDMLRCAGDSFRDTWYVELRQQGVDLTSPRDQAWFEAKVASVGADLVLAGPLYNMIRGDRGRSKQSEETAELAGRFLLDMMHRQQCALIIEAHAPHGDELRVRGSKYWEDWSGYGFGLRDESNHTTDGKRSLKVERFRYDRETGRQWPERYVEGRGRWPWDALEIPARPPDATTDEQFDVWHD